jgi:hypothetical protein
VIETLVEANRRFIFGEPKTERSRRTVGSERTSTFLGGASRLLVRWNVSAVAIATLKRQNQPRVDESFQCRSSSWKSLLNT